MMADENQSSPSSAIDDQPTKLVEEVKEGEAAKTKHNEEVTKAEHTHLTNGFAKPPSENSINENDANNKLIPEAQAESTGDPSAGHHENNNNIDSLEDNNNEIYIEEKTYTSELETSLVVKQVNEAATTSKDDHVSETIHNESISDESEGTTVHERDGQAEKTNLEKEATSPVVPHEHSSSSNVTDIPVSSEVIEETSRQVTETHSQIITSTTSHREETHYEVVETSSAGEAVETLTVSESEVVPAPMKGLDIPTPTDDEDGFVPLAECFPRDEESADTLPAESSEKDDSLEDQRIITAKTDLSELSESSTTNSLPEPSEDEKSSPLEMEQFVQSGGLKRMLTGVQKTEPYSSCTTETKIAMEIREMREREEELRLMREQALLSPVVSPVPPKSPGARSPSPSIKDGASPVPTAPGYRVSSVFGHKGTVSPTVVDDEKKLFKQTSKESAVEREIRIARDREEELRKQKGLPPREDDSYVKPSQVKSSQVRIFGKVGASTASVKQAATAKIQLEIEEQTQREMALRETGSIQTISQERTDAKVAKLKTPECTSPTLSNGNSQPQLNGNYTNGRYSPDLAPYKRSSPSPTGIAGRPASIFSQTNVSKSNINMQKFIASKGKETMFTAQRNGGPFISPKEEKSAAVVPPTTIKLKRHASVESKIQQEIMEMKQREEELKKLHMNHNSENSNEEENVRNIDLIQSNNLADYENGNGIHEEDLSPRHNKLIAQWEQRIQKTES